MDRAIGTGPARLLRTAVLIILIAFLSLTAVAVAQDGGHRKPKTIRMYRVGSSSFGPGLLVITKDIIGATGKFVLDWDQKRDSARYTRLDQFVTQPGLYEEWCKSNLPRIEKGGYDYVVFQTIGWFNFTPEQHKKLLAEILPDLARKIHKTGAKMILYDKFVALHRREKDPRARAWAGRYPEGVRFNYLLHVMTTRRAGIDGVTFGGAAVHELWGRKPFSDMKYFYNDAGHPGVMGNYISACLLSYLMTGVDPVGNPVRKIDLKGSWTLKAFNDEPRNGNQAFYDAYKNRVKDGVFEMTDAEAAALQKTAMKHHRTWSAVLRANRADEAALARTEAEIRRIQGEMNKPEAYGMSKEGIEAIRSKYAEAAEPGGLKPYVIERIRRECTGPKAFEKFCMRYLPRKASKELAKQYVRFWDKHNSKLKDDVFYQSGLYEARVKAEGRRDEVKRMKAAHSALQGVMLLPGYRLLLGRMTKEQKQAFLSKYRVTGARKRHSPAFAAYQMKVKDDPDKLLKAWGVYLGIWTDPNLMDRLKETRFSQKVWLEADKEFEKRIAAPKAQEKE